MIKGFADRNTETLFLRKPRKRFRPLARVALGKLLILHAASSLDDLKVPPGNRLEKLKGDRKRQYSIRITIGGGCAFAGRVGTPTAWRS